jgi:hypothetical protein
MTYLRLLRELIPWSWRGPPSGLRALSPDSIVGMAGRPVIVVDCFDILGPSRIHRLFELG